MASQLKCALLLFVVALVNQLVAGDQLEQLRLVCDDDRKIELNRASELSALVGASASLPENDTVCSKRVLAAMVELDQLMSSDSDNICTPSKANQIRTFYAKYIDAKTLDEQRELKLPKVLKNLFLSYGFGVSRICKTNMVDSLLTDSDKLLNQQDFDQLSAFISDSSSLTKMIKNPDDVDDLVLPKEIFALINEKKRENVFILGEQDQKTSVVLQSKVSQVVKKIQAVCGRRFRPIYEQLILPLVSLSRIGLNYEADELQGHLEEMKTNKNVHLWYRIVYLCEMVSMLEVLKDSNNEADPKRVRILTNEEAEQLRSSQPTGNLDVDKDIGGQINYQVSSKHTLSDLVVNKQNKSLLKLVESFDANKSELRRVRSKVMAQMFKYIKETLKSGKLDIFGKLLNKGAVSSINADLIKAADNIVDEFSESSEQGSAPHGHVIKKRNIEMFMLLPCLLLSAILLGVVLLLVG